MRIRYTATALAETNDILAHIAEDNAGAAAAVGALIVLLPVRRKKIYIDKKSGGRSKNTLLETGFALGALKIAASLVRPVIVELVKNRLVDFAGQSRPSRK